MFVSAVCSCVRWHCAAAGAALRVMAEWPGPPTLPLWISVEIRLQASGGQAFNRELCGPSQALCIQNTGRPFMARHHFTSQSFKSLLP